MNVKTLSVIAIIFALIIPTVGAFVTYSLTDGDEARERGRIDTRPVAQQLSTLTHARLSSLEGSTLQEIEEQIRRDISLWTSSSRINLPGHRVTVLSSEVKATQVELSLKVPVPPASLEGSTGELISNSLMYGSMGSLPLLPGIRTDVETRMIMEPLEGGDSFTETISFSTEVLDPQRGLLEMIGLLEADMNGWGSGMARDLEYMLNTLVRVRTTWDPIGWGADSYQTGLNILNEGDVELAFNIALALRMARWTGQVPENLVQAIDLYFMDQTEEELMNPTGARFWGEAEKNNFRYMYLNYRHGDPGIPIGTLISNSISIGHADSADIYGRYLYLNRIGSRVVLSTTDMESGLEEKELINQRMSNDLVDTYSLEHHAGFPDTEGIPVSPRDDYHPTDGQNGNSLIMDIEPVRDYMVAGRDLQVKGLEDMRAWFTNADPVRIKEENLSKSGNARSQSEMEGCRCGAIPPPPKPPDRLFSMEWNLEIEGAMDVEASYGGYGGNSILDDTEMVRGISFDLPVRVYSWFDDRPYNDNIEWVNLNTGKMYWEDTITGWTITPQANATEIFSEKVYPTLNSALAELTGMLRSLNWYEQVPVLDDSGVRRTSHVLAMDVNPRLRDATGDDRILKSIREFYDDYIAARRILPEDLGVIRINGHNFKLQYTELRDRLDIRSDLPGGSIRLSLYGIKTGLFYAEGEVLTDKGIKIDLYPHEGEYSIRGDIGGIYVDDGPKSPNAPPDIVRSLLVESGWTISSPAIEISTWDLPGPYLQERSGIGDPNTTISFIVAGWQTEDQGERVGSLSAEVQIPGRMGEAQVAQVLDRLATSSVDQDLLFGIRTTSTGGFGSHPVSRTLLFGTDSPVTWRSLIEGGDLHSLVREMLWGASPDLVVKITGEMHLIMIEDVPAWAVSYSSGTSMSDISTVSHVHLRVSQEPVQNLNFMEISDQDSSRYHPTSSGWGFERIDDRSFLM